MTHTTRVPIRRIGHPAGPAEEDDVVAVEEPLEIRIGEKPVSVTMRTPGDDFDLAAGFLFSESIIRSDREIASIRHWGSPNVVRVDPVEGTSIDLHRLQRHFYSTSSCGICGKVSIDAIRTESSPVVSDVRLDRSMIHSLGDALLREQKSFEETGGIHAAGIFSVSGELLRLREDIGRHNAVDKVIGSFIRDGALPGESVLFVSGRSSFEIVQKAIVARIPAVAAVGAASSLAIELAREFGITLVGFVRDRRFNIYSGEERVT